MTTAAIHEVTIRTIVRPNMPADGYRALNGRIYRPEEITSACAVVQELQALHGPARAVLLQIVHCDGGDVDATASIFDALRACSGRGIPVVAFLAGWVASAAPWLALAADFVVMHPGATLILHSAEHRSQDQVEREQGRFRAHALITRILQQRTVASPAIIERALSGRYNAATGQFDGLRLSGSDALDLGFADALDGHGHAEVIAQVLASGRRIWTKRARLPRTAVELPPSIFQQPLLALWE